MFTIWLLWPRPSTQEPLPLGGSWNLQFWWTIPWLLYTKVIWSMLWRGRILKEYFIFIIRLKWTCPSTVTPAPRVMKLKMLVDPFLRHYHYILRSTFGGREKVFKETMHFTIWLIWPYPNKRIPAPESHEIYNFGRPFLDYYYNALSLSDPWEINQFYTFTP